MAYHFHISESIPHAVRRVAEEEIDSAIRALQDEDLHEGIHNARKKMKKLRALWRLIRDELGEDVYKAQNQFYRDQARRISDLRDATGILETIDLLHKNYKDVLPGRSLTPFRKYFRHRRSRMVADQLTPHKLLYDIAVQLKHSKKRLKKLPIKKDCKDQLVRSLCRTYKRGYKAMAVSYAASPTKENFHEWRKRAKYLCYQIELLQKAWEAVLLPLFHELHKLTDLLGDHHDLDVLLQTLADHPNAGKDKERDLLIGLARQHQEKLREEAYSLGRLLYAEKPKDFARRLEVYISDAYTW